MGIALDAEDHLGDWGRHHLLDQDAVDACLGMVGAGRGQDFRDGLLQGRRFPDVEADAAGLGLVGDVRRQ